jgi:hypothetical protein
MTKRMGRLTKTPVLLALVLGLALSASGCIISDSGGSGPGCYPDLTVSYVILDNRTGGAISCAQAGADTVRITVNGAPVDYVCNTGPTVQTVTIPLDSPGDVSVFVELFGYGQRLSSVDSAMYLYVGCSGFEINQPAQLPVVLPVASL